MDFSLKQNIEWLRENKENLIAYLNSFLETPTSLDINCSWDDISLVINNMELLKDIDTDGVTNANFEYYLNNYLLTTINVNSEKIYSCQFNNMELAGINLPNAVTIESMAFEGSTLQKINAPKVTIIKEKAFNACVNLSEIYMPSLTTIGSYGFSKCSDITSADFSALTTINYCGFSNNNFTTLNFLKTATALKTINYMGFYQSQNLKDISVLSNLELDTIDYYAFENSPNIEGDVYLNANTLGYRLFSNAKKIDRLILSNRVNKITGSSIFFGANRVAGKNITGYALKYIACEAASAGTNWNSNWNAVYNSGSNYAYWPVLWNATKKDWIFKTNNDSNETLYLTTRVVETENAPSAGTKVNYLFKCWCSDESLTIEVDLPYTSSLTAPILYGKWTKIYKIYVVDDDNSITYWQDLALTSISDIPSIESFNLFYENAYTNSDLTTILTDLSQITGTGNTAKIYIHGTAITEIKDYAYTGTTETVSLDSGKWLLECWGAEGGNSSDNYGTSGAMGGAGGFASGVLTLTESTTLYVSVGGQGNKAIKTKSNTTLAGGFNGGGTGKCGYYNNYCGGGSGGGASDIRIGTNSVYARVIVAGGGGAAGSCITTSYLPRYATLTGGAGGGLIGLQATDDAKYGSGFGGGQYEFGDYSITFSDIYYYDYNELVGRSDWWYASDNYYQGNYPRNYYYQSNGAGGGGWYGGQSGVYYYCHSTKSGNPISVNYAGAGGGGGSSWLYTKVNFENWFKNSDNFFTKSKWLLDEKYYLTNSYTIAGNFETKQPDGTSAIGRRGNGYIRITKVA